MATAFSKLPAATRPHNNTLQQSPSTMTSADLYVSSKQASIMNCMNVTAGFIFSSSDGEEFIEDLEPGESASVESFCLIGMFCYNRCTTCDKEVCRRYTVKGDGDRCTGSEGRVDIGDELLAVWSWFHDNRKHEAPVIVGNVESKVTGDLKVRIPGTNYGQLTFEEIPLYGRSNDCVGEETGNGKRKYEEVAL